MGYFIVKKEFTNQDDVKIDDSKIPERRLEKWVELGWIEWHK